MREKRPEQKLPAERGGRMSERDSVQKIYGIAAVLGMVESGNQEDALHQLVYGMTGKDSVRSLSEAERKSVAAELRKRLRKEYLSYHPSKAEFAGKMTARQKSKAWALLYELERITPSPVSIQERMAGVVQKELQITASAADPLRWVSLADGSRLIEQLKRYVQHAKKGGDAE